MLRKHFIMSGSNKPDFTITYHAPKHVPFFGGYAKDWVYGYPSYGSGITIDENPIKFKVIGDKWNNGVGEWKFKLEDSSNRIYNSAISEKKLDNLDNLPSDTVLGYADLCLYSKTDENGNIITEESVDNTNIITSVIFGEGIEIINGSVLESTDDEGGQSSCTAVTLPESVTQLTGNLFNKYTSLRTITVPQNVIRIDNLCDGDSLEEVVLKPLTPPDASNTSEQNPLGIQNYGENSSKIRVYADCIDVYKNDSIWGQYSDLYDTINNTIVYYNNGDRKLYTENQDITSINYGMLPQSITNVYLPNSITIIDDRTFYEYTGLTSVVIPNSVTHIGNFAFYNCTGLTSVEIGNSITNIGGGAFYNCSGLTSVEIGNSITSIDNGTFLACSGITSVVWNAVNCSDFGSSSSSPFYDSRTQITTFEFGNSVEHIPAYVCSGMPNLTSVEIGNSVTSIGGDAFQDCSGLTSVVWNAVNCSDFSYYYSSPFYIEESQITSFEFGDGVEHIPAYVCSNMYNLTQIVIPNSVTSIGESAFDGCSGLTQIVIPNSVTNIGSWAFSGCSGLTSITIPNSVTSIGGSAFSGCSGLTSIIVDNSNPIYDSRENCNAIIETETNTLISGCKNTIIPNSVTSIDKWSFRWCQGLTSIKIPNSVTSIGDSAFYNCTELTSVTMSSIVPPTLGTDVFLYTSSNLIIYVPDESVDTYKNAANWSSYSSKIKPISEKPV